jgi:hypothetical protein
VPAPTCPGGVPPLTEGTPTPVLARNAGRPSTGFKIATHHPTPPRARKKRGGGGPRRLAPPGGPSPPVVAGKMLELPATQLRRGGGSRGVGHIQGPPLGLCTGYAQTWPGTPSQIPLEGRRQINARRRNPTGSTWHQPTPALGDPPHTTGGPPPPRSCRTQGPWSTSYFHAVDTVTVPRARSERGGGQRGCKQLTLVKRCPLKLRAAPAPPKSRQHWPKSRQHLLSSEGMSARARRRS